jgi:hypothetical protein
MQARKCSRCDSVHVYKSVGYNWHEAGVVLQMTAVGDFPALFQTEAFLCLDCRNLEIQVVETSTMYGKQRTLAETVQTSQNWMKA